MDCLVTIWRWIDWKRLSGWVGIGLGSLTVAWLWLYCDLTDERRSSDLSQKWLEIDWVWLGGWLGEVKLGWLTEGLTGFDLAMTDHWPLTGLWPGICIFWLDLRLCLVEIDQVYLLMWVDMGRMTWPNISQFDWKSMEKSDLKGQKAKSMDSQAKSIKLG